MSILEKSKPDKYYENKKAIGLLFTKRNLKADEELIPCEMPQGISWWDKELGRYRTSEEQSSYCKQLLNNGKIVLEGGK